MTSSPDVDRRLQFLLRTHLAALRPDHQEVHGCADEDHRNEQTDARTTPRLGIGGDDRQDVHVGIQFLGQWEGRTAV
jgi:hypothetical protein